MLSTLDAGLLLGHAASTLAMAGVIWFVQVVHYPLFAAVAPERFAEYEAGHRRLTTFVVAPLMLAEIATAVALVLRPAAAAAQPRWAVWAGLALLAVIWASTFLVQVPLHERLAAGFDAAAHRRLVRSNWVRTAAWTARAGLALLLLRA
jgi:uncharacterized membrane protein